MGVMPFFLAVATTGTVGHCGPGVRPLGRGQGVRGGSGADAPGVELVEGKDPVGKVLHDVFDAVEFGIACGVSGESFHVVVR